MNFLALFSVYISVMTELPVGLSGELGLSAKTCVHFNRADSYHSPGLSALGLVGDLLRLMPQQGTHLCGRSRFAGYTVCGDE